MAYDPYGRTREHRGILWKEPSVVGINPVNEGWSKLCSHIIEQDNEESATEKAVRHTLPEQGAILFLGLGLDSFMAGAILELRARGTTTERMGRKIAMVVENNRVEQGEWPGRTRLPSKNHLWDCERTAALAPLKHWIAENAISAEERVQGMMQWILISEYPIGYKEKAKDIRRTTAQALDSGAIKVSKEGLIALVESVHPDAIGAGWHIAPVVVVFGEQERLEGVNARQTTIAAYHERYLDIDSVQKEISTLNKVFRWERFGRIMLKGYATLKEEDVVNIVTNHIR